MIDSDPFESAYQFACGFINLRPGEPRGLDSDHQGGGRQHRAGNLATQHFSICHFFYCNFNSQFFFFTFSTFILSTDLGNIEITHRKTFITPKLLSASYALV